MYSQPPLPDPTFWRPGETPGWGGPREGPRAAVVCRQGHPKDYKLTAPPVGDLGFCTKCGAALIGRCPVCNIRIPGVENVPGIALRYTRPPSFCDGCGQPYPWATREDYIAHLRNLAPCR